jgi:AcrR family transcriptional regulator
MAQRTRDRVLSESLPLFAARGFAGTSVTDIEAAAGLSPGSGSFYRHFRSKEDVLFAAVDRELDRVRARKAAAPPAPPGELPPSELRERVAAQLREGQHFLMELDPLITILVRDGNAFPALSAKIREVMADDRIVGGLEDVTAAAAAGGRDPVATSVVAMLASVGYHLAIAYSGGPPGGVSPDRFSEALADMIAAPPTAAAGGTRKRRRA